MLNSQELYQQANQLPPLEKLRLAELLLADLDTPDPIIDAIWCDEAQKRWQAYQVGELKTVSHEVVLGLLKDKVEFAIDENIKMTDEDFLHLKESSHANRTTVSNNNQ